MPSKPRVRVEYAVVWGPRPWSQRSASHTKKRTAQRLARWWTRNSGGTPVHRVIKRTITEEELPDAN